MIKNQQGIAHLALIILAAALLAGGGIIIYRAATMSRQHTQQFSSSQDSAEQMVRWESTADGEWMASSQPPACPEPFRLASPVDISQVTSVLYPGQERGGAMNFATQGGNYKPHGGFRFDNLPNNQVSVTVPISGYVFRGGRYKVNGEPQYTIEIIHPCGILVRLGHLRVLSPTFGSYIEQLPQAGEGDSRTHSIEGSPAVNSGDPVATAVGLAGNTFFDLGVYDLRQPNQASQRAEFQSRHQDDKEISWYAICWFDMLPAEDAARVKSLPSADSASGKTSDYCQS